MISRAYVGLGSNLEQPRQQVQRAAVELEQLAVANFRMSSLYASKAIGPGQQPDYVNAVAGFDFGESAGALLERLHGIEAAHRRVRRQRWGARTLDLDLLLFGEQRIDTPKLRVPHPRLAERPFVLYPLLELDPELDVPGLGPLAELTRDCPLHDTWLLEHG